MRLFRSILAVGVGLVGGLGVGAGLVHAAPGPLRADVNGDGYDELAVGDPEAVDAAGRVQLLYGSAQGLVAAGTQNLHQSSAGGRAEPDDRFSSALAFGDFNGDGHADLAVGAPSERLSINLRAGVVNIMYGSAAGLLSAGAEQFTQSDAGGATEAEDAFGERLVVGDLNGDGDDDLVVGVRDEGAGPLAQAGVIDVLYGSPAGLTSGRTLQLSQSSAGGVSEAGDAFGFALSVGDFDHDGDDDLAVGAPTERLGPSENAGVVNVLPGSADGLSTRGARQFTQSDLAGAVEAGDAFGQVLSSGDYDGDGYDDLAAGTPQEDVTTTGGVDADAGAVNVIHGSATGLQRSASTTQFTESAFFRGSHFEDFFGTGLLSGDLDADGRADLLFTARKVPYSATRSEEEAQRALYGTVDGLVPRQGNVGYGYGVTATGDFNGDGVIDSAYRLDGFSSIFPIYGAAGARRQGPGTEVSAHGGAVLVSENSTANG